MTPEGWPKSRVHDLSDYQDSKLHSVVRGRNDYNVPSPSQLGTPEFEIQRDLFLSIRHDVTEDRWPDEYFGEQGIDPDPPAMFESVGVTRHDPQAAARLVDHAMDHPLDLHMLFVEHFGQPRLLLGQDERTPQSAGVDFLGFRWFDSVVTGKIYEALVEAFQVKNFFCQQRPEHYFESGKLVAEYGCPEHLAYVAGHGAIAGATVAAWETHVDPEQFDIVEGETAGLHYAHYRSAGGVHWPEDNEQGYWLGKAVSR